MNGSSTTSFEKVYSWMQRYGSSEGNGAGWPIFFADSVAKSQTDLVNSRNSSFVIVSFLSSRPGSGLSRPKLPLENTRMYSCTSRSVGLEADCHEPHAVELLALAALFQMTSPRIRKPSAFMSSMM